MDALAQYRKAKRELEEARAFAARLDTGRAVDVVCYFGVRHKDATVTQMPPFLRDAVQEQARQKAKRLVDDAIIALEVALQSQAETVRAEYAILAADAGVTLPGT